ncbi:MAG: hypothetical protein AB8G05_27885 [Oligoflexales bacterium]
MIPAEFIHNVIEGIVLIATDRLIPLMIILFCFALFIRVLIFFMVTRELWFTNEFYKRVHRFVEANRKSKDLSFYIIVKKILERTFYELYEVRAIMKRRKLDAITPLGDRIFLIQHGSARVVSDTLTQVRHLKHEREHPKLLQISKTVFENNPSFKKLFGIIPTATLNDFLGILPGIFIIGGIFGTFLGIMKALPELGGMDLSDVEGSKTIMDDFLLKISFSMTTSIVGIMLSVALNIFNTFTSPDKIFINIINRFENSLDILWNLSEHNNVPEDVEDFDEHRDPIEALAEKSVDKELGSDEKYRS